MGDVNPTFPNPTFSGFLRKRGQKAKTWKRRFFVVNHKTLYYFKSVSDRKWAGAVELDDVIVSPLADLEHGFAVRARDLITKLSSGHDSLWCRAESAEDCQQWIDQLNAFSVHATMNEDELRERAKSARELSGLLGERLCEDTHPMFPEADFSGWLTKQATSGKRNWQKRFIVVSNHYVYYFKSLTDKEAAGSVDLKDTYAVECINDDAFPSLFGLKLLSRSQGELSNGAPEFALSTTSELEMRVWVKALNELGELASGDLSKGNVTVVQHRTVSQVLRDQASGDEKYLKAMHDMVDHGGELITRALADDSGAGDADGAAGDKDDDDDGGDDDGKKATAEAKVVPKPIMPVRARGETVAPLTKHTCLNPSFPNSDFEGWLYKSGLKGNKEPQTWKKRYFVLDNGTLYYFANISDKTHLGSLDLADTRVILAGADASAPANARGKHVFALERVDGGVLSSGHAILWMALDSGSQFRAWKENLDRGDKAAPTYAGLPLARLVAEEGTSVPRLVDACLARIETSLDTSNLYRDAGDAAKIQSVMEAFGGAGPAGSAAVTLPADVDVHSACGALKRFLHELPEPVIPFAAYKEFLRIGWLADGSDSLLALRNAVRAQVPVVANEPLLARFVRHLVLVDVHSSQNGMNVQALASVLAPFLLRDVEETVASKTADAAAAQRIVTRLVAHIDQIFGDSPITADEEAAAREAQQRKEQRDTEIADAERHEKAVAAAQEAASDAKSRLASFRTAVETATASDAAARARVDEATVTAETAKQEAAAAAQASVEAAVEAAGRTSAAPGTAPADDSTAPILDGWAEVWDESFNLHFYVHKRTRKSTWTRKCATGEKPFAPALKAEAEDRAAAAQQAAIDAATALAQANKDAAAAAAELVRVRKACKEEEDRAAAAETHLLELQVVSAEKRAAAEDAKTAAAEAEKAKKEAEEKAKKEAEEKAKKETEEKAKKEAEEKARLAEKKEEPPAPPAAATPPPPASAPAPPPPATAPAEPSDESAPLPPPPAATSAPPPPAATSAPPPPAATSAPPPPAASSAPPPAASSAPPPPAASPAPPPPAATSAPPPPAAEASTSTALPPPPAAASSLKRTASYVAKHSFTRESRDYPDSQFEGYLTKRGQKTKSWKKRYFVINGLELVYLKSPTDKKPQGVVALKHTTVKLLDGGNKDAKGKFCFQLMTTDGSALSSGHDALWLSTDDEATFKAWRDELKRATDEVGSETYFGATLQFVCDGEASTVPSIVTDAFAYVVANALDIVGIYRLSGNASEIKALKSRYNEAQEVDMSSVQDPHAVSGLLKLFLRELAEPLFPFAMYTQLIRLGRGQDNDEMVAELRTAIREQMPEPNRETLRALIYHLRVVAEHSDNNKMHLSNLTTLFAPNIIRPQEETTNSMAIDGPVTVRIFHRIIDHADAIFA